MTKKSGVYTKTGDKGKTSLVGGTRVSKNHVRLDAYGTVDELNSYIGWLNCVINDKQTNDFLLFLQHKLFVVGSYLATETEMISPQSASILLEMDIARIESEIDLLDAGLPKINRFVLPGGSESASRTHICRTVCRRAERSVYRLLNQFPVDETILVFLNRLSDYFFVLARRECNVSGREIYWEQ